MDSSRSDYTAIPRFSEKFPHVAFLQEIDKSMSVVKSVSDYAGQLHAPAVHIVPPGKSARAALERILSQTAGRNALNEVDSKALLDAYGVPCPNEALAHNESEAVTLAKKISFPVVAKAVSADLAHKSDAGGVILGLENAAICARPISA